MHPLSFLSFLAVTLSTPPTEAEHPGPDWPATAPEPTLPAHLSLAEAVRLFRAHGIDLLIADAQAEAAAGDLTAARALPNPSAGVGLYHSFFSGAQFESHDGWFVALGDSGALEGTLSGKRRLRAGVAEAALAAARLGRADAERVLVFQVKQQYLQAALAGAALDFAREVADRARRTVELNQIRYRSGAISEVDLVKVQVAALEAEQAVDQALQAQQQAKVGLAFLLGQRHGAPRFEVDAADMRYRVPAALAEADVDRLVNTAWQRRPDLGAQEQQAQRAGRGLALARRSRLPDLALGLQYQQQGTGSARDPNAPSAITPPTLQLTLSGALPIFYQQQGEIRRAGADLGAQVAQRSKLAAQVLADVQGAWAAFTSSRRQVERMEGEGHLLALAGRARELVELQYRKGAASLLELLDAERTYIATNLEHLQNLAAYWTAIAQLELAVATEFRS